MVKNESIILLSHNGKNELFKGVNACTYIFNNNLTLMH